MMNETVTVLKSRRSVRQYSSGQIEKEQLDIILEAGTFAPSGKGKQCTLMVAVSNKAIVDQLSKLNAAVIGNPDMDPFYGAPTVVVVFADQNHATYLYDGSLVMGNLMNAAHSIAVDSCWIHRAKEVFEGDAGKALKETWGVPAEYEGIGFCILGYRAGDYPTAKPRKDNFVIYVD